MDYLESCELGQFTIYVILLRVACEDDIMEQKVQRQWSISRRMGTEEAGAAAALTDKPGQAAETLKYSKN